MKMEYNRPNIFVLDKKKKEITLIEVDITKLDLLKHSLIVNTKKYELANKFHSYNKCKFNISSYIITWKNLSHQLL